jgi:uncharacterized glyoxalase superfamily protein PhnB
MEAVSVGDLEALHRTLAAARVAFVHPPQKAFWGCVAELLDPDGYVARLWDERAMHDNRIS